MTTDTVLITGASGVIGTALQAALARDGFDRVVAVRSIDADLTDQAACEQLFAETEPSLVFHLAARVYGIMGNMANRAKAYVDNVRMNTNVIDSAQRHGARKIVAMGSTAIYSDEAPLPMSERDIWLREPHESEAPYAHSKRAMFAQLETYYKQYGLEYAYCVSTNLYGPNDKFDEEWGHVLPSLISKFYRGATSNTPVTVWGTGKATRDFFYAADAARAMIMIARGFNGPINFATGESHSIADAVELLTKISGLSSEVIWDASKPDGQRTRQYDVTGLRNLGFQPEYSLEAGLAETFAWYAEHFGSARR